ncbi:signal peptidase I [Oceaniserpentilla sp. 4NH20-0058]|uniref:signal peptidase I n=1 Tax=Oceaniserpentilla sp. 4NH20-0058 TaxID=3127660 RepID=UPI00310BF1AB
MDIDFPLVLVLATFITGLVALADKLYFAKKREELVAELESQGASEEQHEQAIKEPWLIENSKGFFPVLALVLVLRSFLVEPFQIPSGSMEPTLIKGDFILVNKFAYGFRLPVLGTKVIEVDDPQRGDVMVFIPPHDPRYFIKRVIGLPGDHIRYINKKLYINGEPVPTELVSASPQTTPRLKTFTENDYPIQQYLGAPSRGDGEWVVPQGHYFMLGDNRDNSGDSRFWGFVPDENIVGKAFAVWMHWEDWSDIPSFGRNKFIH